jgi:hypothetical protein
MNANKCEKRERGKRIKSTTGNPTTGNQYYRNMNRISTISTITDSVQLHDESQSNYEHADRSEETKSYSWGGQSRERSDADLGC